MFSWLSVNTQGGIVCSGSFHSSPSIAYAGGDIVDSSPPRSLSKEDGENSLNSEE